MWELDSFTLAYSLPKHSNQAVLDTAALRDGWLAISAGEEGQVKIWDLLTRPISISPAHSGHVTCTRFSVCGSLVASGGHDGVVLVHTFMLGSRKFKKALTLSGPVTGLAPFRDNKRLVSSSLNGPVCIWDASGDVLQLRGREGEHVAFTSVSVSWSSDYIAAGDVRGQVTVWESESGKRLRTLQDHSQAVMAVAFCESSANQLLVSGDAESILCIRDLHDASFIQTIHLDVVGGVTCLRPQPGGSNIVTASSQDPTVSLWSLPDGHLLSTLDCCSSVNDVAVFSVKGTLHLLTACSDYTLRLWEVTEEEKSLKAILPTDHFPHCCDVGSDGESILAVYGDSQGNVASAEICFEGVPESFNGHLGSLQHLHSHATPAREMEGMDQDAPLSQNEEDYCIGAQSSTEASSPLAMHLAPTHSETEQNGCHQEGLHADTSHPALLVAPEKGSPLAGHSGVGSSERETKDSSPADRSCWDSDKQSHFDFEVEIDVDRDVDLKTGEQAVQSNVLDSPAKNSSAASVAKATVLSKSQDKHLQEQQTASSVCTLL